MYPAAMTMRQEGFALAFGTRYKTEKKVINGFVQTPGQPVRRERHELHHPKMGHVTTMTVTPLWNGRKRADRKTAPDQRRRGARGG